MYNGNQITAEVKVVRDPERAPTADVVKVGGAIFQGKKEDGKDPIWIQVNGWKSQAKCLETVAKGDTLIVAGSLSQESWEKDGQKQTKLVITCDTVSKKVWANNGKQQQQPPAQQYGGNGGYQQSQSGGYQQNQNQGGGYTPPDDDIPF